MREDFQLRIIARLHSGYSSKFGVPRQSGLGEGQLSEIRFEPDYRDENALRGIEGYSHLWLIWGFSGIERDEFFRPMVKPPRLGGNKRMGVFATRSPYRPNPLGLSSVELIEIQKRPGQGMVLIVSGADLMDGTPIYDIKPYLSFTDSHPNAKNGFAGEQLSKALAVDFPEHLLNKIPQELRRPLIDALSQDPRPAYQRQPDTPYGMPFMGQDVRFKVFGGTLHVYDVVDENTDKVK